MKSFKNIFYNNNENPMQSLDVYIPECDEFDVLLYFHGGGIEAGSKDNISEKNMAPYLTSVNCAVVSAEYRMYPDAKYPDFIYDAANAVAWVVNNIKNYGKMKRLFVGGTSAGAYLSMMLCFDSKYLKSAGISNDVIDGYIHDAGQPTTHFNILRERGLDKGRCIIDEAAPLYHIGIDEKYPPMLIICSDNDMKCRYEQLHLTLATLKRFGYNEKNRINFILVENSTHCSYFWSPEENKLPKMICSFINEELDEYQTISFS